MSKPKLFNWRKHLPVHPAADLFPLLPPDELKALAADIKANDLHTQIVLTKDGLLLDGRNRLDALASLGCLGANSEGAITCSVPIWWRDYSDDPYTFVISANIHRRHLTGEQKDKLIAELLKARPEQSNRAIAKQVKADDKTVGKVRRKMEATAEIPQLEKTVGADGKARKQPAAKPKKTKAEIAERDREVMIGVMNGTIGDACIMREMAAEAAAKALADDPQQSAEQRKAEYAAAEPEPADTGDKAPSKSAEERWQEDIRMCALESSTTREAWEESFGKEWSSYTITPEMIDAADQAAQEWNEIAGLLRTEAGELHTQPVPARKYVDLLVRANKLEDRNSELSAALNAKEQQASRNWPVDMKPKQVKRRDDCLKQIAAWQRALEQLYGEVTGQPSWRVEITTKDGRRLGNGARFGTHGEAEKYKARVAADTAEAYAAGEVIPCGTDKANMEVVGDQVHFQHGDCVLLDWREIEGTKS
jgi:hypothetical protein